MLERGIYLISDTDWWSKVSKTADRNKKKPKNKKKVYLLTEKIFLDL